ncbi:sugar phosphate isomerase/epimerase [Pseudarthrobacter oxydans]|uniref:sugar phosphate isomerase/epimerase family protein n=1 Tax=Pseudarthrobacter oxydans TaxID=1671 RepID=UPI00278585C1|nr:TIM barrel protein [Pseudarthrobacter oxydans]MDP9982592.1 sugar phosphate isomerase/epimerase [Pseudarthrobacter oxydans]
MSETTTAVWPLSGFGDEIDPDPAVQAAVLLALGAGYIEVRSAWGTNVSELEPKQVAALKDILDEKGLKVSAVASPIGKVDVSLPVEHELARLRQIISVAKGLDTKYVRIFSFYRADGRSAENIRDDVMVRMGALAALAEEAGVVLLHENEKGIFGDTPERVLDIMTTVDSPALRVAWDNANFVQVGVKPYTDGYAMLRPYLEYFQVKDALSTTGEVVPAGEGDGELDATIAALKADGYSGFASLEPHLASAHELGGFSGPVAFGTAARAFAALAAKNGVELS